MKSVILLIASALLMAVPGAAAAQNATGPGLEAAITAWLENDDADALPALAILARAGDRDARILLGQITNRPQGDWLNSLDKGERNNLLRAPEGLSGKSWLEVLADGNDVHALALHTALRPPHDFAKLQALLEHGETETAMRTALTFVNHGGIQAEFAALPQGFGRDGAYTAYLPMIHHGVIPSFRLRGDQTDPVIWTPDALLMYQAFLDRTGEAAPDPLPAWLAILNGDVAHANPGDAEVVGAMIDRLPGTHRNLLAARRFCDQSCPADRKQCLASVVVMQRAGFNGLWAFTSPSNIVIGPDRYYQSRRAVAEIRLSLLDRLQDPAVGASAAAWVQSQQCLKALAE